MKYFAHELFLLTTNLSQLQSKILVIKVFIESINNIYSNHNFTWLSEQEIENINLIPVCTRNKTYGYIQFNDGLDNDIKSYAMLQNAIQILAVILERIDHEELLIGKKNELQQLVDEQTKDLIISRDEIKSITENSPDIIVRFDSEARYLFANSNAISFSGIKAEDFLGKTHKELGFPLELCKYWESKIFEVFKNGEILDNDFDFQFENKMFTYNWRLIPEYDTNKNIITVLSIYRDITERKQAEIDMSKQKVLFEAIFNCIPDAIVYTNVDREIIGVNLAFSSILGFTSNDIVGKKTSYFYESLEEFEHQGNIRFNLTAAEHALPYEVSYRRKDGSIFPGETLGTVMKNASDKTLGYIGVIRDITERKEAEREMIQKDTLLNLTGSTAKVGGWELNTETMKLTWTEEVYHIYELDFNFIPNVENTINFYNTKSRPIIENAVQRAIEFGDPFDLELEFITAKGNKRWVHSIGKVSMENGKTKNVFGSIQDITERKEAEDKIRASLKEKEILLREIHHRVKNNFQVISSLINLQANSITDERILNSFQDINNRIKSMSLIHELMYSTGNFVDISLNDYINKLIKYLRNSYLANDAHIKTILEVEEVPLQLDDLLPIGLILNELISNSFKHAFPNEREGEIIIVFKKFDKNNYILSVKDSGIGIQKDFDMQQSNSLGLLLVSTLTRQLHGEIEISALDVGTEIIIKFGILV